VAVERGPEERVVPRLVSEILHPLSGKIANAVYEAEGTGGSFLGKPYEPNVAIKNDVESTLMLRKPGATGVHLWPHAFFPLRLRRELLFVWVKAARALDFRFSHPKRDLLV
jgi:hypothetical protein